MSVRDSIEAAPDKLAAARLALELAAANVRGMHEHMRDKLACGLLCDYDSEDAAEDADYEIHDVAPASGLSC